MVSAPATPSASLAKRTTFWEPPGTLLDQVDGITVGQHEIIRGGDDIALGDNSDVWVVGVEGLTSRLAVSQPYNEFHDLCVCYVANGWTLNERQIVQVPDSDWSYSQASFVREDGAQGLLFFSGLAQSGTDLNPIDINLVSRLAARAQTVLSRKQTAVDYKNLMVQLWTVTPTPPTQAQIAGLRKLHLESRGAVKSQLKRDQS